jgi:hypothetical protein
MKSDTWRDLQPLVVETDHDDKKIVTVNIWPVVGIVMVSLEIIVMGRILNWL